MRLFFTDAFIPGRNCKYSILGNLNVEEFSYEILIFSNVTSYIISAFLNLYNYFSVIVHSFFITINTEIVK